MRTCNLKTVTSLLVFILMSGYGFAQEQSATLKLGKNRMFRPYGEWSDNGKLIKPEFIHCSPAISPSVLLTGRRKSIRH
jgi:hypothetical protein